LCCCLCFCFVASCCWFFFLSFLPPRSPMLFPFDRKPALYAFPSRQRCGHACKGAHSACRSRESFRCAIRN
jgi:hypothetical protein